MITDLFATDRRFFVPEVVQTSAMDCGPATLKAILEGHDISASYGRLREACQTDVDGTSIDTLEEVAIQLGLDAEQIMVPVDHLLLSESQSLPAIVVVRQPNGLAHFVVVWTVHGQFIQVMDPAVGRRWLTRKRFLEELFIHNFPVPEDAWRNWAGSDGFCNPLRHRLQELALPNADIAHLIETALNAPGWHTLAALDATTRMVDSLVQAGGLDRGAEASNVLKRFFEQAQHETPGQFAAIPDNYWSVFPAPPLPDSKETISAEDEPMLIMRGAVLVRVQGLTDQAQVTDNEDATDTASLSPELVAALEEKPTRPELQILAYLKEDGLLTPGILILALALSTGAVLIEALLLRGLLDIGQSLGMTGQRIGGAVAFFTFLALMILLELPITATVLRIGRRFETRLRVAFLEKIPRLGDKYFHSRLTSDMTHRAHDLRQLRDLPTLGVTFIRLSFRLLLTALGVIWLMPSSALPAILSTIFAVGMSIATQPVLIEQDLRLRTHIGALSRFYLDAMLGLVPVRTHSAERAVRREHESLLVEWVRVNVEYFRLDVAVQAVSAFIGTGFSVWILFNYVHKGGDPSGVFLLFYWALSLPVLGQSLAHITQQYPIHRNRMLRLLEPLNTPDETEFHASPPSKALLPDTPANRPVNGVALSMENVSVQAGGHTILTGINLNLKAEEHIAIVGPSGAGKSSIVGLLLGWHRPATGHILVDGQRLDGQRLQTLRRDTAWVDPAVRLWNRTLLDNLRYGTKESTADLNTTIEHADLFSVLERLPNGQQTCLGEGGGLVSGGEGQRVRLGRAILRPNTRLVILDEPFRGLDREQRRALLARTRQYWAKSTLICITHDVSETQNFERVLVIEHGKIIEDDSPAKLLAQPNSRYKNMLNAETEVRQGMWGSNTWRRLWLDKGKLKEK